jgi:hypothetical protein
MAILSPALMTQGELIQAYRIASSDPRVEAFHAQESRLLLYVIPVNWYLPDLPLHTLEEIRRVGGGHRNPLAESGIYRVLFARPRLPAYRTTGHEIVTKAYGLEPLGIVRVDLPTESLIGWDEAPDHVIWGDIPTPLF